MEKPLLSVCLITYKQESYIQQAIKSVFEQKVSFPVEFVISNDASPDKTHEKIEQVIKDAPQNFTVKYFNHEENLGMMKNYIFSLKKCSGKYIALCEGDDYWIDSEKIKRQINFLETHNDFSLCFSNAYILNERNETDIPKLAKVESREYFENELLSSWLIPTASTLFINQFTENDFKLLSHPKVFFGDVITFLILANKGKIYGMEHYTSVYRLNAESFTNRKKSVVYYEKLFNHIEFLSEIYQSKYMRFVKKKLNDQGYKLFRHYALRFNHKCLKYYRFALKYNS